MLIKNFASLTLMHVQHKKAFCKCPFCLVGISCYVYVESKEVAETLIFSKTFKNAENLLFAF